MIVITDSRLTPPQVKGGYGRRRQIASQHNVDAVHQGHDQSDEWIQNWKGLIATKPIRN